ncbi:cupin-like domain-containing protein [Aureococcus anophagefferens]|nr:cupin-like domain-containing protein [Aureococcus anophagefferens]
MNGCARGPAAKPRTFAEFRPEESRPGWLGGVGAVGGERPAFVGGRDDGASYPYPAILSDPVSDEMSSERGLAYRAAYQQYRRGFAEGASGERPRAAPTPPRHTPSPPPLPRRTDRGHASSLVGPSSPSSATPPREVSDKIRHARPASARSGSAASWTTAPTACGTRSRRCARRTGASRGRTRASAPARLQPAARREPANPYDRGHPNGGAPPFAPPRQTGEGYDGGDAPNFDAMREDLHARARGSTLEGRQRSRARSPSSTASGAATARR